MHKYFEVRDVGTRMVLMCFKFDAANEDERHLVGLSGFGTLIFGQNYYTLYYWPVDDGSSIRPAASYDIQNWHPAIIGSRTQYLAMKIVEKHWSQLCSGDVIDIEYAIGETTLPKCHDNLYPYKKHDDSGRMLWMKDVLKDFAYSTQSTDYDSSEEDNG